MRGIAGYIGDFVPELMARMNAAQAHRGPDGQDAFEDPEVRIALGHAAIHLRFDACRGPAHALT